MFLFIFLKKENLISIGRNIFFFIFEGTGRDIAEK